MTKSTDTAENRIILTIIGILLSFTAFSAIILSSLRTSASDNATDDISITVQASCTLGSTINTAHTATLIPGTYSGNTGTG